MTTTEEKRAKRAREKEKREENREWHRIRRGTAAGAVIMPAVKPPDGIRWRLFGVVCRDIVRAGARAGNRGGTRSHGDCANGRRSAGELPRFVEHSR